MPGSMLRGINMLTAGTLACLVRDEVLEVDPLAVAERHRAIIAQLQNGQHDTLKLNLDGRSELGPAVAAAHYILLLPGKAPCRVSYLHAVNPEQDVVCLEDLRLLRSSSQAAQQHTCKCRYQDLCRLPVLLGIAGLCPHRESPRKLLTTSHTHSSSQPHTSCQHALQDMLGGSGAAPQAFSGRVGHPGTYAPGLGHYRTSLPAEQPCDLPF